MNTPDKEEISRLSAAIMRRVEFDQSIHASSIEDEIGKWVREFLEPKPIIVRENDFSGEIKVKPGTVSADAASNREWSKIVADAIRKSQEHNPVMIYQQYQEDQQRRTQALAQQKFNQHIADGYGGLAGLNNILRGEIK